MFLATLFAALSMVTHLVLGILVLVRSPRNPAHRTFSGMLLLFFVWSGAELAHLYFPDHRILVFLLLSPVSILPYFFARFTALFPRRIPSAAILSEGAKGYLLLLPALFILLLIWSDQLFSSIDSFPLGFRFQFGRWEYPAKLILAGYLLLALNTLQQARSTVSAQIMEKRIQYTFAGLVLPAAGGALFLIFGRWFFQLPGQTIYIFGIFPALGIFMAALLGYAMLRYRLLEIDLIFSIGLVYTLMTAILAGGLEIFQNLLQNYFEVASLWATVFSSLILAAVFNPLKSLVGMMVDYFFGRQDFDSAAVLKHFLREMRRCEKPAEVLACAMREASPVIGFRKAAIILEDGTTQSWPHLEPAVEIPPRPKSLALFEKTEEIDTLLEIAIETDPDDIPCYRAWQSAGLALAYPFFRETTFIGIMFLGPKNSRLPFSDQERNLMGSVCHEIPPILENLRLVSSLITRDREAREVGLALQMYRQIQAQPGVHDFFSYRVFLYSSLAESIKGDMIDVDASPDNPFVCLCDAFHQGIPAALTLYVVRTALRASPQKARIETLNRLLRQSSDPPLRAAISLLEIQADGLAFSCAGNPPPLLLEPGCPPHELCLSGSPVGLLEHPICETIHLPRGQTGVLLLVTNGLWKAFGDETGEGFRSFLEEQSSLTTDALYQRLLDFLTSAATSGTMHDDISFVLIQEKPSA